MKAKPNTSPQQLPLFARAILSLFVKGDLLEGIEGDLLEYVADKNWKNPRLAWQLLMVLRPLLLKRLRLPWSNVALVRLHWRFAWRSLLRQKLYMILNVVGLALSMTCCLFIGNYILRERGYDTHWADNDRIFRVYNHMAYGGTVSTAAFASSPMAKIFQEEFDEVELAIRWATEPPLTFQINDRLFKETQVIRADQGIIDMFSLKVLDGSKEGALDDQNSVILTQSTAMRYFGKEHVAGRFIETSDGRTFRISAVIADLPWNSHFSANVIRSTVNDKWSDPSKVNFMAYWTLSGYRTYVKLKSGTDPHQLEQDFFRIYEKYFDPVAREFSGQSWQDYIAGGNEYYFGLQPLLDIYLFSDFNFDGGRRGVLQYVVWFGIIGAFILLIAFVNFTNLTSARANLRLREVAIKKIIGSSRSGIGGQFFLESNMVAFLGLSISVLLVYLLEPWMQAMFGDQTGSIFQQSTLWLYALAATIIGATLAAIYPASVLVQFGYRGVLAQAARREKKGFFRSFLVVFQFTIAIALALGTLIVNAQLHLFENQQLGYDRDNILIIKDIRGLTDDQVLASELSRIKGVANISAFNNAPGDQFFAAPWFHKAEDMTQEGKSKANRLWVDHRFIETFGIKLLKGRNFSPSSQLDSSAVLVNQAIVRRFGLDDPIGKKLRCTDGNKQVFTIVGVLEDFYTQSLRSPIVPTVLHKSTRPSRIALRYEEHLGPSFLDEVDDVWQKLVPGRILDIEFLEEKYDQQYQAEFRAGHLFELFVTLALVIAGLGLLGLTNLVVGQKRKEVVVRKVLGATVREVIMLLNWHLTKPILVAVVLGSALGLIVMDAWLSSYAQRIDMSVFLVALAVIPCLVMSWLVITFVTFKSANMNPAEGLRQE